MSAPVRVLFVSSHAQLGGGEAYLRAIVEALGPDWTAGLVSLHEGPFVQRLREDGYDVEVLPAHGRSGVLKGARALRRTLRATPTDVVHANGVKAALVAALATIPSGPPILWLKYDFGWDGALAALVAARCRMVVGISAAVNATLRRTRPGKVRVVFAGIPDFAEDHDRGREVLREALGGDPPGPVVVQSGRLCPGKGQHDTIAAAPTVLARHPDTRFVFLGVEDSFYPDFRAGLEEQARTLGVHGSLAFSGLAGHEAASAVAAVSVSDVLVQPSRLQERGGWKEGFGLAVVEAMAVGTPVVVYANGALPEVVADCGIVVPEGDHDALGSAIADLLSEPAMAADLRERARRRATERFRLERVVAEMADCYRELVRR